MGKYTEELNKLNPLQRQAVEHIDGPLLVIAGPGTGKTQLLSMRVAYILKNTDTDAGNILCLTFTNKASTNMRERILGIVGSDGRKVQIKTFHSFAAEIMNQYPEYFWNGAKLSIAPEASQLEIIQNILSSLPLDNPLALKFAGKFTAVDSVLRGLKLAKEAGLTPDKLKAIINANISYINSIENDLIDILSPKLSQKTVTSIHQKVSALPDHNIDDYTAPLLSLKTTLLDSLEFAISQDEGTNKTSHVSKWKARWIKNIEGKKGMWDERKRNDWWLQLADVYQKYREELHIRGFYDYSDMLVEVLTQMESRPDLLADIQERYLYVMIDEFQDTNAAQLRLAHLVADHPSANGRPNIMAVGDDDQAIFAFNGAELNNMLFFDRNYLGTKKIILTQNYRSTQKILDTASKVIEHAEDRLVTRESGLSKNLVADYKNKNSDIVHLSFATKEHQMSFTAREVEKLRKSHPNETIAILARSHDSLKNMASLLLHLGVPVSYELKSNILDSDPVEQVILLAKTVNAIKAGNNELVSEYLAKSLRHPMWGIKPETLWQLALNNQYDPDWLSSMTSSGDKLLASIAKSLLWLSNETDHQPLGLTIEYLLGLRKNPHLTSPVKEYFSSRRSIDNNYLQTLSAFRMLRELVHEFASTKSPGLSDFVAFIELNQKNNKVVSDESPFVSDSNAVELYSVHKAKGLEFDIVFVIDAVEENWQPKGGKRKPPANLPLQPPLENNDDYARLLYVAATRAKHTLIVTSYRFDSANKEVLASPMVRASIDNTKEVDESEQDSITVLEEALAWPHLDKAKEKHLLKGKLAGFSINVTNLLNFLDVTRGGPEYFFERNILRLPEAKTPTLSYGTAMHEAMEQACHLTNSDDFNIKQVIKTFKEALMQQHLPAKDQIRLLEQGENVLKNIFVKFRYSLPMGSKSEQRIKGVRLHNAVIDGKLDRVDIAKDKLIIVDYKTGRPLSSFDTKDRNKQITAWRQKTQLIFYALLAKHDPRYSKINNLEGQMIYLEADSAKDLINTYQPTNAEIEKLERLIEAVWQKIINVDLPDISKYQKDLGGIQAFEEDLINENI